MKNVLIAPSQKFFCKEQENPVKNLITLKHLLCHNVSHNNALRQHVPAWMLGIFYICATIFVAAGMAQAEATPLIRFAYQDRIGSVIPIIAVEKGYFEQEGVRVESVQFNSGPANAEALYSGSVDIAGMGDAAALILLAQRPDIVVLASHATGEQRHRLMVREDSLLKHVAGLRGKTVAVKKGTSTHGALLRLLKKHGLSAADVQLMDLSPSTMSEALAAGSIHAFAASEPTPSIAEAWGARELATSGGLGNTYPILLVAPRMFVDANHNALTRFFRALKRAEVFANAHRDEVAEILARQSGLSVSAVSSAMSRHTYALQLDQTVMDSLQQTAEFLHTQGVLSTKPDCGAVCDPEVLSLVHAEHP